MRWQTVSVPFPPANNELAVLVYDLSYQFGRNYKIFYGGFRITTKKKICNRYMYKDKEEIIKANHCKNNQIITEDSKRKRGGKKTQNR